MSEIIFNTGETPASLKTKYNADGTELRKMQLRMLEMLIYIKKICEDNNITYWLSSGTLLGAVRHKGFIPWDDDLDIEMPREDYQRLCKVLKEDKECPYILQDHDSDPFYFYAYSKLRDPKTECVSIIDTDDKLWTYKGIWIDIFILESIPVWLQKSSWYLYSYGRRFLTCNRNPVLHFLALTRYQICYRCIFPLFRAFAKVLNTPYLTTCLGSEYPSIRRKEYIKDSIKLEFEGEFFNVPKGFDGILNDTYSFDYHLLPPEDMRGGHYMKVRQIG